MPTGVFLFPSSGAANAVDDLVEQARNAYEIGVRRVWLGQQFDLDAIATSAVIGAAVPGLGVGTSVVPVNPRHPLIVASLAQTAQAASHGNFSLGVGLGAPAIERRAFGIPPANSIDRLRDHLAVLRSVFDTGAVDFEGDQITARPEWSPRVAGGTPVPLYVAAMGPRALQVAGELADGTLPFLAGPRTIADFIRPTLIKAAADAGRPAPRVIAAVPILVSEDVAGSRATAEAELAFYDSIPSYQKVIAREGLRRAADLAVIGSTDVVSRALRRYRDSGADDLVLLPLRRSDPAVVQSVWRLAAAVA